MKIKNNAKDAFFNMVTDFDSIPMGCSHVNKIMMMTMALITIFQAFFRLAAIMLWMKRKVSDNQKRISETGPPPENGGRISTINVATNKRK